MKKSKLNMLWIVGLVVVVSNGAVAAEPEVSFDRDVKPILSKYCYACHGPDEEGRKAKLRLDVASGAMADLGGYRAVEPGKPGDSELIARVATTDEADLMPPPKTGKKLTAEQVETLRRWVASGAEYEKHWAFEAPRRPGLPAVDDKDWPRNAIDRFVLAKLEGEGLSPSPEVDRYTLIRRVYLDLIGLPPTPEQADAFVADKSADAYEKVVDALLTSEHYGERWARQWLDLARYADTNGYEKDRPRSIWPYRDWVIDALNADMPFDRFTIEQLAGDMLPNATASQRIATGFHRNTMLNEEGGIDPLEFRYYAMMDRVATTGSVWLGLTTGCAQCHTHKYDPITHTDYFRLMALLNNADEPELRVPDAAIERKRRELSTRIAALEAELAGHYPAGEGDGPIEQRRRERYERDLAVWIEAERERAVAWRVMAPHEATSNMPKLTVEGDGAVYASGDVTKRDVYTLRFKLAEGDGPITALRLEALPDERLPAGGPGLAFYEGRQGDFFLSEVTATLNGEPVRFAEASHSYGKIGIGSGDAKAGNVIDGEGSTGWSTAQREGEAHQLVLNLAEPVAGGGELKIEMLHERHFAAGLGKFRWSATSAQKKPEASTLPVDVEATLAKPREKWSDDEAAAVARQFVLTTPELAEARKEIDKLRKQMPEYATTLVMQERPADHRRPTHLYHRGEYLQPKQEVEPALPSMFAKAGAAGPTDRLSFAQWLVSRDNPLVARVTVNRAWQAMFGTGLVETSGDFGTQGAAPTHPRLLDWLAVEFMEHGWSMKRLHRLIVTSATYRQSSAASAELAGRDPANRLLARGPRFRMQAEMVRDSALTASGVLTREIGGPSVFPPQPDSVTALAYGNYKWRESKGADRYRRSLYTFAKRTAPFAAYTVFDAPTGESCVVRRDRSNTPLQALTLLNDEMYLELARAMARAAMAEADTPRDRATALLRRCVTRPASAEELDLLLEFHAAQLARLKAKELDADAIAGAKGVDAETAAWVMAARAVMNLDEAITKP